MRFFLCCHEHAFSLYSRILGPNPATDLVVSSVTGDGFTIGWTAPTTGMFTKFQVTVKDGTSVVKTDTPAKETTTSVFTGLEAGKKYTVTVVTVNGDTDEACKSSPLTETFATSTYLFIPSLWSTVK